MIDETRQVSRMVDVCMRKDTSVDGSSVERRFLPIAIRADHTALNRPQSISTRGALDSIRYFEPVTVRPRPRMQVSTSPQCYRIVRLREVRHFWCYLARYVSSFCFASLAAFAACVRFYSWVCNSFTQRRRDAKKNRKSNTSLSTLAFSRLATFAYDCDPKGL